MKLSILSASSYQLEINATVFFALEDSGSYYLRVNDVDCLLTKGYTQVFRMSVVSKEINFRISDSPVLGEVLHRYQLRLSESGRVITLFEVKTDRQIQLDQKQVVEYKKRKAVKY